MSFEDIRDKWMVIGTSNKRKSPLSPKPFLRKCVGEKGIGRFAVDKLGDRLSIITKQKGAANWLKVNIHQYGLMKSPTEIIKDSCNSVIDTKPIIKYYTDKYSKIYNL